jgi:hypothetical protein
MLSSPDDGEADKSLIVKSAGRCKSSELKLKVEVRGPVIALVVNVDGMKLTAETCVACPHGLLSILGGSEIRKKFTCDCDYGHCASRQDRHLFNVMRHGEELIWSRTNYPAGSSSVAFDYRQACVEVCAALLELKAAVDAHPAGIASCAGMMPCKFTYDELLSCIEQAKQLVAKRA